MVSPVSSILSRVPAAPSLTSIQAEVDAGLGDFLQHATSWTSLTAMGTAGIAYRLGRIGFQVPGSKFQVFGSLISQTLSVGAGLSAEVSAFELTHRGLSTAFRRGGPMWPPAIGSTGGHPHGGAPTINFEPNLWKWSGPSGLAQGLLSSVISFGTLRGFNRIGRDQNILLQHLAADLGLVTGHNALAALNLGPLPTGRLAEQMLHAEATTLQFQAGMNLFHAVTPGLTAMGKALDMGLTRTEEHPPVPPFASPLDAAIVEVAAGYRRTVGNRGLIFMTGKEGNPKTETRETQQSDVRDLKSGSPPAPSDPPTSEKAESGPPPFDEILQALEKTLSVPPEAGLREEGSESADFLDPFSDPAASSSPAPSSSPARSWEGEALGLILNPPALPPYARNLSKAQYQLRLLNTLLEKNLSFDQWSNLGRRIEEQMGLEAFLHWALRSAQESPDGPSLLALFRLSSGLFKGPVGTNENRLIFLALRKMARYHPEDPVIGKVWSGTLEALPWEISGNPLALSEALKSLERAGYPLPFVDTLLAQAGQEWNPEFHSLHREAFHLSAYAAICRNWKASTDPLVLFLEAGYLAQRLTENGDWARALTVNAEVKKRLDGRGSATEPLVAYLDRRIKVLQPLVKLLQAPSFSSIHQLVRQYRQGRSSRSSLPTPESVIRELKLKLPDYPAKALAIQEGIRLFTRETLNLIAEDLKSTLPPEAAPPILAKIALLNGLSTKTAGDIQIEGAPSVVEIAQDLMKLGRYDLVYRTIRPLHSLGFVDSLSLNNRIILPILQDLDEVLGGNRRENLLKEAATIDAGLNAMGPESSGLKRSFLASKNAVGALLTRYEDAKVRKNFEDWKAEFTRWMAELF